MAEAFPSTSKKSFKTKNGPTYSYVYKAAKNSKPTFLLLHGFPSTADDWCNQISDLTAAGYGVLAPDMLGYGDTDKPAALEAYAYSKMTAQIASILDHEGLKEVIGVGHDWGSSLLGKFWNYYPQYFSSLIFMSVPYTPGPFDLVGINAQTEQAFGYPVFGYMEWFNETDSVSTITKNTESLLSLIFPNDPELWRTDLCPRGKAEEWVRAGKTTRLPSYENLITRAKRIATFKKGGWAGPINWYRANIRQIDSAAESQIPPANIPIPKPVLFVAGDKDYATRAELSFQIAGQGKEQGWLPTVEVKVVQGGSHWMMLEKPKEVFSIFDALAKSL